MTINQYMLKSISQVLSAYNSPIVHLNLVNWNYNATARELRSAEEILTAQNNGELEIAKTNILINSPAIKLRQ
jgi:hypothetical protein